MSHRGYFRLVDSHDTIHLATASMQMGYCFCGFPQEGTTLQDEAGKVFPPGVLVEGTYCEICVTRVRVPS